MSPSPTRSSVAPFAPVVCRRLLLVDDDEDAVVLTQMLFQRAGLDPTVEVASDGEKAVAYLQERINAPGQPLPDVVLLDLKLPRKDGFEVLEWIRSVPSLAVMRVIIMSSSSHPQDVERALRLGASAYWEKYPSVARLSAYFRAN